MGVKISGLTAKGATIADTDLVEVSQSAGGGLYTSRSVTGANIKALVTDANMTTSDITTNDVSTAKHGFAPKAPNDTAKFLRGDGTWAVPASGGLTEFTEAENTSTPNATVPVNSLTPVTATTNADVAIVPKGTGAFMLDIPDNTTAGGNKRGTNAVDLQMVRGNLAKVASGDYAVISGGYDNTASGARSMILGGDNNTAAGSVSYAIGGSNNSTSGGVYTGTIGYQNTASANWATAIGATNGASGQYSVAIGQSNTASGANATTIGKSNIANAIQATAIGTSATASGTNSISIGNTAVSSGVGSVAIGTDNTRATADYSVVLGYGHLASAQGAYCLGIGSTSSGFRAGSYGNGCTASGEYSHAMGNSASTLGIYGRYSYASGQESVIGDSQASKFVLHERTTDNTATTLTTNSSAASTTNQVILSNQSAYGFTGTIVGKQSGSTNACMWKVTGLIARGANAASTVLTFSLVDLVSNAPGWGTPVLTADTTNGGLQVQVVGLAATNIQWTANIETTEVIYA